MSNNTSTYDEFVRRADALNEEAKIGKTGDEWMEKLEQLKADIFNSSLTENKKDELYDLLELENSRNNLLKESQRKSRKQRKARKQRKSRKARKTRKTRNV
jgi:hypothetical protein